MKLCKHICAEPVVKISPWVEVSFLKHFSVHFCIHTPLFILSLSLSLFVLAASFECLQPRNTRWALGKDPSTADGIWRRNKMSTATDRVGHCFAYKTRGLVNVDRRVSTCCQLSRSTIEIRQDVLSYFQSIRHDSFPNLPFSRRASKKLLYSDSSF